MKLDFDRNKIPDYLRLMVDSQIINAKSLQNDI